MMQIRRISFALILMIIAGGVTAFAQAPLREEVYFTINVPFELRKSDVVFPAGKYILYQPIDNDQELFALYRENMQHSPVAWVRTVRIDLSLRTVPIEDEGSCR